MRKWFWELKSYWAWLRHSLRLRLDLASLRESREKKIEGEMEEKMLLDVYPNLFLFFFSSLLYKQ